MAPLSVGLLNVILKVAALSIVALSGELVERCFKLLAKLRLLKKGRSPLVFPTDGEIFNVRSSLKRFGSFAFLGMGILIIVGISVVPAEIMADFGVNASEKCSPAQENTYGLCGGMYIATMNSQSKMLATALSVEDYGWNNQDLVENPIRQGFHKRCDGTEYFGDGKRFRIRRNLSLPIAITGCYSSKGRIIQPKGTFLTFGVSNFANNGIRLLRIETNNRTIAGVGELLYNYAYHSVVCFNSQ